jgi:hypothetical protein
MKRESLRQLPKTLFGLLRRAASNTLTPQEESALWLGLVGLWLYGITRIIDALTDVFATATNVSSHFHDPVSAGMLAGLMAYSGLAGLGIGAVSVMLWSAGKGIRRRGGRGGTAPGAHHTAATE